CTESAVLALIGGACGLTVAYWGTRFLLFYVPGQTDAVLFAGLDGRALAFTMSLVIVSATVVGLVPAIRMTRLNLSAAANDQRLSADNSGRRPAFQGVLIAFQVSLSVVLLVCAGLFVRTLHNLRSFDLGFDRDAIVRF